MTPERIGKYPVERRLGGGGMGSLYLARHPDLGHLVAIKTLKADYQDDPDLRERFLREARSAAQLAHANIVKVYDFVADAAQPFIVMEFIDGDTLGKRLRTNPPLTLEQKLTLFDELCSGLAHAHAAGIVHRDIKPANLMLDHRGVLRILDFGIARLGNSGMTLEGMMMGSVNYMSPEQIVGRGVDNRADIFAAGAVMYEVLTLEKAFPGDIDGGALHRILHEGPTPITQRLPDIDPELAAIVERALQRNIDARYRSADEMGRDLSHVRRRLLRRDGGQTVIRSQEDTGRVDPERLAELKLQQLTENVQAGAEAFARRQFDEARRFAERAIAVDPTDRSALELYDRARFAVQAEVVQVRLDEALTHLAEGRIAEADAALGGASVTLPNVPEATELRKQVRAVSEKVSAAREREHRIEASLGRARASIEQGGYDTALRAIYEVLSLDPDRAEARELESHAKTRLHAKRELERAERTARAELRRARDLLAQGLFDAATAVISVIESPSDAVRSEVADAQAAVDQARRAARVSAIVTAAREALAGRQFDDVLATLGGLESGDATPEVETLRAEARQGIEREQELERKRRALDEGLAAVQQLIDGKDLVGALERLEAVTALGLVDERIGALRHRIADLGAQEHQRRLEEARNRQAERRVEVARQLLSQGQEQEAISLLERDEIEHPAVLGALSQIREEVARRERARQEEERQRVEEEERRRREEDARLAVAAAEERQREEERAATRRREEDERRRQESERRRLAEEAKRRADEAQRIADEARRRAAAEEARAREAARLREEEEQRRQDADRLRRADEARRLQEEEAHRLAEAERQRQAEEERQRKEEERRREEAVTLVVTRVSNLRDHNAALTELREAATLVPNDPRIATLIRQREAAIEARAAAERARAAEETAAHEREAQRQRDAAAAQVDDQARRLFAEGRHQEALDLLRAAVAHATVSTTIASLESELKEIERTRAAEEARRLREEEAHRLAEAERQLQAEAERQRKEEERRREEAVTLVVTRVSSVQDHDAALTELRQAATLVPNDPRIVTLIRQREDAIEARAAAARARAAQEAEEREREAQRQRDAAAAQVDDQARRLFAAGGHQEALDLLRAAVAHPTVSTTIALLERELKEIERTRAAEERRMRRTATLGKVKGSIADRRVQAVGALLVVGVAAALVLSRQPVIDRGEVDRSGRPADGGGEASNGGEPGADIKASEGDKRPDGGPTDTRPGGNAGTDDSATKETAKRVAEERAAADAKRIAEERVAADARRVAEERAAADAKRIAEERAAADAKRVAEERAAADAKRVAEERAAADAKRAAEERAVADAKRVAAERAAAEAKRAVEERATAARAAVERLLERYVQAYESLDEGRVRQIDPGFNHFDPRTKSLLKALQVRITGRSVQLAEDGQTARLTATQNVTYDWRRSELPKTATIPLSWNLRKEGGEWRVVP